MDLLKTLVWTHVLLHSMKPTSVMPNESIYKLRSEYHKCENTYMLLSSYNLHFGVKLHNDHQYL